MTENVTSAVTHPDFDALVGEVQDMVIAMSFAGRAFDELSRLEISEDASQAFCHLAGLGLKAMAKTSDDKTWRHLRSIGQALQSAQEQPGAHLAGNAA